MDWKFWAPTLIASASTIITAYIAYKKEDDRDIKWWVILIPIGVAIASVIFSWSANQESNRALKRTYDNDSTYRSKFNEEIDSSRVILANLKDETYRATSILKNTGKLLIKQDSANLLLMDQIRQGSDIERGIISSEYKLKNLIDTSLNNVNDNLTGGGAYPIAEINQLGTGIYYIFITNYFNHIVPNVSITLENYSLTEGCPLRKFSKSLYYDYDCIDTLSYSKNSVSYPPNVSNVFEDSNEILIKDGKEHKIILTITTAKYQYVEQLLYTLDKDYSGGFTYRILRLDPKKQSATVIAYNKSYKINFDWEKAFNRPFFYRSIKFQ